MTIFVTSYCEVAASTAAEFLANFLHKSPVELADLETAGTDGDEMVYWTESNTGRELLEWEKPKFIVQVDRGFADAFADRVLRHKEGRTRDVLLFNNFLSEYSHWGRAEYLNLFTESNMGFVTREVGRWLDFRHRVWSEKSCQIDYMGMFFKPRETGRKVFEKMKLFSLLSELDAMESWFADFASSTDFAMSAGNYFDEMHEQLLNKLVAKLSQDRDFKLFD